jgi:hypothetical protein
LQSDLFSANKVFLKSLNAGLSAGQNLKQLTIILPSSSYCLKSGGIIPFLQKFRVYVLSIIVNIGFRRNNKMTPKE